MSDDTASETNRRNVLKAMAASATAVAFGVTAGASNAAAEDANGTPYCYEAGCDPKFEPGTVIEVDGPSSGSMVGTWENCCVAEDCSVFGCGPEECPEGGYRQDGESGVVQGTCSYGPLNNPNVLVRWHDGVETHVGEDFISRA